MPGASTGTLAARLLGKLTSPSDAAMRAKQQDCGSRRLLIAWARSTAKSSSCGATADDQRRCRHGLGTGKVGGEQALARRIDSYKERTGQGPRDIGRAAGRQSGLVVPFVGTQGPVLPQRRPDRPPGGARAGHAHAQRHRPPRHQAQPTCCLTTRGPSGSPISAWPKEDDDGLTQNRRHPGDDSLHGPGAVPR